MHEPSQSQPRTSLAALLLGAAVVLTIATHAAADEVVLKSGKVRRGDVVSQDARFIVLESRLGRIRIPASEVVEVRRSQPDTTGSKSAGGKPTEPAPDAGGQQVADEPGRGRPVIKRPARNAAEPRGAGDDEARDDAAAEGDDASATQAAPADDGAPPSDRLRRMRARRVVRRTTEAAEEALARAPRATAKTSIGGRVLGRVPRGTEVIVFQPPRPFEAAPGAIEIGKRTIATMEMAGATSAWLGIASARGEQRLAIRLADVKRHVEVTSPAARVQLFEGISTGDWVRIHTKAGQAVEGRLTSLGDGLVNLQAIGDGGVPSSRSVSLDDIVTVDGVIRDRAAERALSDIEPRELLAITFWPSGDQIMGRQVDGAPGALSIDTNDDGVADRTVLREGPLAEVLRVPERHRRLSLKLRPGNVVRVTYRDDYPDAAVRRTTLGSIEALTAFAIALRQGGDAVIVPFDGISDLVLIEDEPLEEIRLWNELLPRKLAEEELPVLPGTPAADVASVTLDEGISTVSDGRTITHVFVSAPFAREMFGIRIGERVSQATRRSSLRFDTKILPRVRLDAPPEPRQLISDSLDGLRVVILSDGLNVVTGIEISRAE